MVLRDNPEELALIAQEMGAAIHSLNTQIYDGATQFTLSLMSIRTLALVATSVIPSRNVVAASLWRADIRSASLDLLLNEWSCHAMLRWLTRKP